MRRLLKFINLAAQLMALIDIGKTVKHWTRTLQRQSIGANYTQ